MSRRFFHYACVLLLLIAQQGALVHAMWHASAHAQADRVAHTYDTHNGRAQTQPLNHDVPAGQGSLGAFDLAFGQVLGGTHSACLPAAFAPAVVERIHERTAPRLHAAALSPKSRGPPVLL